MPEVPIRVSCKNNVQIVLTRNIADMELDRWICIIVEPNGENFDVLDIRTFVNYFEALFYVDQEQTEHNADQPAQADWYSEENKQ